MSEHTQSGERGEAPIDELLVRAHEQELEALLEHPESGVGFIKLQRALEAEAAAQSELAAQRPELALAQTEPELEDTALLAGVDSSWAVSRGEQSRLLSHLIPGLLLMLGAAGVIHASGGHWREGSALLAGALGLAAVCRAVLPERLMGLLISRGRVFDTLAMLLIGGALALAAAVSPPALIGEKLPESETGSSSGADQQPR